MFLTCTTQLYLRFCAFFVCVLGVHLGQIAAAVSVSEKENIAYPQACICPHKHKHTHACTHARTRTHTCTHTCRCAHTHAQKNHIRHPHTCRYAHTHTHKHTSNTRHTHVTHTSHTRSMIIKLSVHSLLNIEGKKRQIYSSITSP